MSFIFVSYSRKDQVYVRRLVQALGDNNFPVWLDDHINYGARWPLVIQQKLEESRLFLLVMSHHSSESGWVQNELLHAKKWKKPIFPLLLEGEQWMSVASELYVDVKGEILPPTAFFQSISEYFPAKKVFEIGFKNMDKIFQKYKALKNDVIQRYEKYRSIVEKPANIGLISKKIEEVKGDRFTLALAGEVKAGKSTFINALLGEMILPTGFLQSTSAIIEIFHSRQKCVEVVYGNGVKKRVVERPLGKKGVVIKEVGKNETLPESSRYSGISDFLRVVASVQEKYRDLPFQKLNTLLLEYRNKEISDDQINDRIISVCNEYNTHNVEPNAFRSAAYSYFQEFRDLSKIPLEIKLGYPLKSGLEELRIIDTPGVNAIGGLEDITYDYLSSADAIIFLQPANNGIEKASFRKFVEDETTNRIKGNLFLVLTKSATVPEIERSRKLAEAKRSFSQFLAPERMVSVDSLLKIVADHAKQFSSFSDLLDFYREKAREYKKQSETGSADESVQRKYAFYESVRRLLRNIEDEEDNINELEFQKIILEKSGFDDVIDTLGKYSSTAPLSRAVELLSIIVSDYESEKNRLLRRIKLIFARIESSERFQEEIDSAEAEIEKYKNMVSSISQEVCKKYMSGSADWVNELKRTVKEYKKKAKKRLEKEKKVKKVSRELSEELEYIAKKVARNVVQELAAKTLENSIDFNVPDYSCSTPKVSGLGQEMKEAKSGAYKEEQVLETREVETLVTMKKPGWFGTDLFSETYQEKVSRPQEVTVTVTVLDSDAYIKGIMGEVKEEFNDARDSTESEINSIIRQLCRDFENQGQVILQQRRQDIDELRQGQPDIEECRRDVDIREKTIAAIDEQLYAINPILIAYKEHME